MHIIKEFIRPYSIWSYCKNRTIKFSEWANLKELSILQLKLGRKDSLCNFLPYLARYRMPYESCLWFDLSVIVSHCVESNFVLKHDYKFTLQVVFYVCVTVACTLWCNSFIIAFFKNYLYSRCAIRIVITLKFQFVVYTV